MTVNLKMLQLAVNQDDAESYRRLLEEALQTGVTDSLLSELDDLLVDLCATDPAKVKRLCLINLECYATGKRAKAAGQNYNPLIYASAQLGEPLAFLKYLEEGVEFSMKHHLLYEGLSISRNALNILDTTLLRHDESLVVLECLVRLELAFQRYSKSVEILRRAAFQFSSVGAFQSAYRALDRAQDIATSYQLAEPMAQTLEAHAIVASDEPDIPYAEEHFQRAIDFRRNAGLPVPVSTEINLATMKMRLQKFEEALSSFERLLEADASSTMPNRLAILMNTSVCKRNLGAYEDAIQLIDIVLEKQDELSRDQHIEALLISVRHRLGRGAQDVAQLHLRTVIGLIEEVIGFSGRLHYRRGARERFAVRLKELLFDVPPIGRTEHILPLLAFLKLTAIGDWLSLLDWCEATSADSSIDASKRKELAAALEQVVALGAPILLGFREKYDDPFEGVMIDEAGNEMDLRHLVISPWKHFNLLVQEIARANGTDPYARASIKYVETLLREQLATGRYLILPFFGGERSYVVTLWRENYRITTIDSAPYVSLAKALHGYRDKWFNLSYLMKALNHAVNALAERLALELKEIADEAPVEIIVLPDASIEMFPLSATLFSDPCIRALARQRRTVLRVCPMVYRGRQSGKIESFLGLWEGASDLALPQEELQMVVRQLPGVASKFVDISQTVRSGRSSWLDFDIIHLASHGSAVSIFTDPYFSGVTVSFELEWIQRELWKSCAKLVLLNACHASSVSNRNFQRSFETDENVSYPALCLLNRQADVVAPAWATFDVVGYVFSHLFYREISAGRSVGIAYSYAVASLYELARVEVVNIVATISDPELRRKYVKKFEESTSLHPFQLSYCFGVYSLTSLLP